MRRIAACSALALALVGCRKVDPIFCENHPDDPGCAGDGGVVDANGFTIGGTVNGLTGAGLVLQNNGADDKQIVSAGKFTFPTPVPFNSAYDVTVSVQPTNPSQNCTVASGSGTANADVDTVAVNCTTATYNLGGTVVGLSSGTVTMVNGGQMVSSGNGPFMFPMQVASGSTYNVTLANGSPAACHLFGGTGTIGDADVMTVVVNCNPNAYTVGGTVTGLNGSVQLQDNGGDTITISANGSYAFPTPIAANGGTYNVTVLTQPGYPPASQTCVVSNGSGTVTVSPVTNVDVSCTTNAFHVGGSSTGVSGSITLQNNGSDDITQTASGPFTFATPIASGQPYAVTVSQTPVMLGCSVMNASGTITTMDITNVGVTCKYKDGGIKCGGSFCAAGGGDGCCDPEGTPSCQTSSSSCSKLYLPCDSSADCGPGKSCCVTVGGNSQHPNVSSVSCTNGCMGPVLCDPNAPKCGFRQSCRPYGLLPGYYSCQ